MKKIITLASCMIAVAFGSAYGQAGVLDSTFGVDGRYSTILQDSGYIGERAIALQSDEKIVVGALKVAPNNQISVFTIRYLKDGGIDSSFWENGVGDTISVSGQVVLNQVIVQPDDKILVGGGNLVNSKQNFFIARFNANGSVDSTFNNNGYKIIPITALGSDCVFSISALTNGKILLGGRAGSVSFPAFVQLNTDGSIDNAFGINGVQVIDDLGFESAFNDMKVQSDNKIVSALYKMEGPIPKPFVVIRLNANGTKDNSFGNNGLTNVSFNLNASGSSLILQADNKIVIVGAVSDPNVSFKKLIGLARLNTNGSLDNTFGTNGKVLTNINFSINSDVTIIPQPTDGKLLVLTQIKPSSSGKYSLLTLRYLTNGNLDTEFGGTGHITETLADFSHYPEKIFYTDEGKILITGYYSGPSIRPLVMVRYKSCGMSITSQPQNTNKEAGTSATFTVVCSSPSAVYQWQQETGFGWENLSNGGQYSGVHTASLTVSNLSIANNNGQSFRSIGISGACSDTSAAAILTVTPPTGIGQNEGSQSVKVYPNPVFGQLTITADKNAQLAHIKVMDIMGREIADQDAKGHTNITIDATQWQPSLYLIRVGMKNGTSKVFHITKY